MAETKNKIADPINLKVESPDINQVDDGDEPSDRGRISAPINAPEVADLASRFVSVLNKVSPNNNVIELAKSMAPEAFLVKKAGFYGNNAVTSGNTFGAISYMPTQTPDMGILQWPGIPPDALTKISRDNLAPQMIIRNRVDDVVRYSEISTHPWKPGWQIVPKDIYEETDDETRREIREAEKFLLQGGMDFDTALERDEHYFVNFTNFLSQIVDSSLIYDGIAIWTNRDKQDRVISFAPFPAQNVRLVARPTDYGKQIPSSVMTPSLGINYAGSGTPTITNTPTPQDIFAVGVDEAGNVQYKFTRKDLIWYVRNPRADGAIQGYGHSEIESALLLIKGFTDALIFNTNIFSNNSIPKGILLLKGTFTNKQFDAFCYSEDTEVLTKTGWKLFGDVDISTDEFATMNIQTKEFEWQKASHKTWQDYVGYMYHLKSRTIDLIVTPNHRIVYETYNTNDHELKISTAEEIYNRFITKNIKYNKYLKLPATSKWIGSKIEQISLTVEKPTNHYTIPEWADPKFILTCKHCDAEFYRKNSRKNNNYCSKNCIILASTKPLDISGNDYCALMGAFLSEGWTCKPTPNSKRFSIAQKSTSKGYLPYKELLEHILKREVPYSEKQGRFNISGSLIHQHLKQFSLRCYNKFIPDVIMNATPEQIMIFLKYFELGDGTVKFYKKSRKSKMAGIRIAYITTSKKMADQLQELVQKIGFSASIVTQARSESMFFKEKKVVNGESITRVRGPYNTVPCYTVNVRGSESYNFQMEKIPHYSKKIGCVSVPNGTLYVRRKNKPTWCGNSRAWNNLQRSPRNDWSLPVMQVSDKGGIEILPLEALRGNEGYYTHLMNLFFGAFSAVYRFPVHRLGYKISGTNSDPKRDWPRTFLGDEDEGLAPLLMHLESLINDYLIWSRWPHLQFVFTAKSPREDARLYEARMLAMSLDEKRREVGLPKYADMVDNETAKAVAEIMGLAPVDPVLTGVYSTIINALARVGSAGIIEISGKKESGLKTPRSEQTPAIGPSALSKKDPAKSEDHGHMSGVRRDSRREKNKNPAPGAKPNGKINQSHEPNSGNPRSNLNLG